MNLPAVRPPEHEATYHTTLPYAVRSEIDTWAEIIPFVCEFKSASAGFRAAADKWEYIGAFSEQTIRRKFYAFKKSKDWKVFINKSKLKKQTSAKNIINIYRDYALANQRSNQEGWRRMLLDFEKGKYFPDVGDWRMVWAEQNKGCTVPYDYPRGWIPRGWMYTNLQKLAKITLHEVTVMRKGRAAARDFLPPVLTTRVGLEVGRQVMIDDVWHDCIINEVGTNRRGQREIEFAAIDVASAHKVAYGMQPRREDRATGRMKNVPETRALELIAYVLCYKGYHPEGCLIIGEHGTASIPAATEKYLDLHSDGAISVTAGGIISKQMHNGLYPGAGRGNFKLKAALESSHAMYHSVAAHLPGQVGMDPAHSPEEHGKLAKHNEHLITCYKELMRTAPERAAMLAYDVITHEEYTQAIASLYQIVSERHDHHLEGWRSSGNVITEFRVSASASDWIPMAAIGTYPAHEQQMIRSVIRSDPKTYTRSRQLSRAEAYAKGQGALRTFTRFAMPHILGPKLGKPYTVADNGMISFRNQDFGPDEYHYNSRQLLTPDGYVESLNVRREYIIHANPFNIDEIFVSEKDSGAVLGIIPRYGVPTKTDTDAINRKIGKQAKEETRLMKPLIDLDSQRKRMKTRSENLERNIKVLRGDPVTPEEKAELVRVRKVKGDLADIYDAPVPRAAEDDFDDSDIDALDDIY